MLLSLFHFVFLHWCSFFFCLFPVKKAVSDVYESRYFSNLDLDLAVRTEYRPSVESAARVFNLSVELLPYQRQTVDWMLEEEQHEFGFHRHFYVPVSSSVGSVDYWYSPHFQVFYLDKDLPKRHGGLICEEMGLGKTMEIFAVVATNQIPRPPLNSLICHHNTLRHQSSITLVIVPASLLGQWEQEFHKHMREKLTIFKFYGSNRPKYASVLLEHDIGSLSISLNFISKTVLFSFFFLSSSSSDYVSSFFSRNEKCWQCI